MSLTVLLALSFPGILGGTPTTEDQDCVAVGWVVPKTERFDLTASGTLISPRLVLTMGYVAASAEREKRQLAVFFGSDISKPGLVVMVQRVINHPEANTDSTRRAPCLLVLERDVPANVAQPRPIAPAAVIDAAHTLRVVGFGANDSFGSVGIGLKRKADILVVVSDCGKLPEVQGRCGCKAGQLVAVNPGGQHAAAGDTGGPACVQSQGHWLLAAITDRAVANATRPSGDGGIYVRLDRYQDWINQSARAVSPRPAVPAVAMAPRDVVRKTPGVPGGTGRTSKTGRSILQSPSYRENMRQFAQRLMITGRVAGALGTLTAQFPDCVAVGDSSGRYFATGTLIAPRMVLTAGHAFEEGIGQILIGGDFRPPGAAVAVIKVKTVVKHPDFKINAEEDLPHFLNDLTVLILERDVKPEEATPRVIAPESAITAAKTGMVVGFGSTGDFTIPGAGTGPKRAVEIPLASSACDKVVDGVSDSNAFGCAVNQEMVAADPLRKKDSCVGDSGGPLYVNKDGQ